jgi:glycosyltransferase involved in cell wall biosynthesis
MLRRAEEASVIFAVPSPPEVDAARIAVLIPAFNEARQIGGVLAGLPDFVDDIVVIDDASTDDTAAVVRALAGEDPRIRLIRLEQNQGVGGALSRGYVWAREQDVDVAVSLDGDGQMDPEEMVNLISLILSGEADYAKGNRLVTTTEWARIPRIRLFGNSVLSLLTKIVSGYWHVADSQSGYTAASRYALHAVDWEAMYSRYGRPNDVLVLANVADCRVADVPVRAIYGVGERSSMKILKVIFSITFLLFRRFWWRLFHKYVLRDFHPLVFFYLLSTLTGLLSVALSVRLVWFWVRQGFVPEMTALTLAFLTITTLNSVFFAFWMDREANAGLAVPTPTPLRQRTPVIRESSQSPAAMGTGTRPPPPGSVDASAGRESRDASG